MCLLYLDGQAARPPPGPCSSVPAADAAPRLRLRGAGWRRCCGRCPEPTRRWAESPGTGARRRAQGHRPAQGPGPCMPANETGDPECSSQTPSGLSQGTLGEGPGLGKTPVTPISTHHSSCDQESQKLWVQPLDLVDQPLQFRLPHSGAPRLARPAQKPLCPPPGLSGLSQEAVWSSKCGHDLGPTRGLLGKQGSGGGLGLSLCRRWEGDRGWLSYIGQGTWSLLAQPSACPTCCPHACQGPHLGLLGPS